jgi:hypothetical protein
MVYLIDYSSSKESFWIWKRRNGRGGCVVKKGEGKVSQDKKLFTPELRCYCMLASRLELPFRNAVQALRNFEVPRG